MTVGLVLGIDGGNTKSVAVLADSDGSVLATASAGCGDVYGVASEGEALRELGNAVMSVLEQARASPGEIAVTVASLAGADWPEDHDLYRAYLAEHLGLTGHVVVVNDGLGPLRLGDPAGVGVSLAVGTGAAIGARGSLGESWHGSFWLWGLGGGGIRDLAERALGAMCRSALGLAEESVLTAMLLEAFRLSSAEELLHHLTARSASGLQHWAPCVGGVLLAAAGADDALAASVVRDYAGQIADYVCVAAGKVGLGTRPFTVVMAGGLLQGQDAPLVPFISRAIRARAPQARPQIPASPPVAGAVLEAMALLNGTTSDSATRRVTQALPANSAGFSGQAPAGDTSVTEDSAVPVCSKG